MAKTEPLERSLSWFPCLAGWTVHPLCRRLRKADKANPDRWIHLVSVAHQCKAKGRLQMPDGTRLTVEDLAYDHDREDEEWDAFMALCESLGLTQIEADGCIVVANWSNWNREAAHEKESAKYKKRAERSAAEVEKLQAQMAAERAKFEADLAESRRYLNDAENQSAPHLPLTCPPSVPELSPACPDPVPRDVAHLSPNVPHLDLDETRLDKDKSKSNSACDRSQRSSEDTKFDFRIRACYQKLLARPLAGRDEEETFTQQLLPAWRKFDASARAEAIEQVAATTVVSEDRDLWRTVLADALALLEQSRARPQPEEMFRGGDRPVPIEC